MVLASYSLSPLKECLPAFKCSVERRPSPERVPNSNCYNPKLIFASAISSRWCRLNNARNDYRIPLLHDPPDAFLSTSG